MRILVKYVDLNGITTYWYTTNITFRELFTLFQDPNCHFSLNGFKTMKYEIVETNIGIWYQIRLEVINISLVYSVFVNNYYQILVNILKTKKLIMLQKIKWLETKIFTKWDFCNEQDCLTEIKHSWHNTNLIEDTALIFIVRKAQLFCSLGNDKNNNLSMHQFHLPTIFIFSVFAI